MMNFLSSCEILLIGLCNQLQLILDIELFHMYLEIAFLNGELDEEMYLEQPSDFEVKRNVYKDAV